MPKPTCLIDGCETLSHRAGRCAAHYAHALAAGECGSAELCKWPDCDRIGSSRQMCGTHYARARSVNEYDTPWIAWEIRQAERAAKLPKHCGWPECPTALVHSNGFCKMHARRAKWVGTFDKPWELWILGGNCVVCGKWADGTIRNQRFCSMECNLADWKRRNPERLRELGREHVRRRRARILETQVDKFTDKDVRMAHGDICYLCNEKINFRLKHPNPKSPSLDHVIPLSRGGTHTLDNAAMVHYVCNQKKGVKAALVLPQPTLLAI